MSPVVLDASAGIALISDGANRQGLSDFVGDQDVLVPEVYNVEVANVVYKQVRWGDFDATGAADRLCDLLHLPDEVVPLDADLLQEALREALVRNHPVYDLVYAVTARRRTATLVTLDRRLAAVATAMGLAVVPDA